MGARRRVPNSSASGSFSSCIDPVSCIHKSAVKVRGERGTLILKMIAVTTLGDGKGTPEQREGLFPHQLSDQKELSRQGCQGESLSQRPPVCSCPAGSCDLLRSSQLVTCPLPVKLLKGRSLGVVLRTGDQIKSPLPPAVGKAEIKPWSPDRQHKA